MRILQGWSTVKSEHGDDPSDCRNHVLEAALLLVQQGEFSTQGTGHGVVPDGSTERLVPFHHLVIVFVQNRPGRLSCRTAAGFQ